MGLKGFPKREGLSRHGKMYNEHERVLGERDGESETGKTMEEERGKDSEKLNDRG